MNEKPILFNSEMVNAILSGRKTQTRRIMGNQPAGQDLETVHVRHNDDFNFQWYGNLGESSYFPCPLGKPGDQLWVREAFAAGLCTESTLAYRATHKTEDLEEGWGETIKWTPSIHMPRWASRINLLITGVRVERLQDISDADASAEGCKISSMQSGECLSDMFARLWKSIYGDESWQANPWVWVIEFERMEAK
ncbi:TPA: hypothetical protein ACHW2M_004555 [Yersinia enterocolitica]|nr:hypothetical protein [Yersinia enterocolitica]ELI8005620.1 hypothetical protein [Yersinia enterocolitica]HEN3259912.1 hypothetical protein [Yersinia enterocolitica]HEN3321322.1 hypothetical protein [Yersinia enterocolitica]HEN3507455.1 hypothetical protein [Yersinia enterocolitica]